MTTVDTSTEAVERLLEDVTPGPWRVGPVDDCRVEDADGNEVAQIDGDYNQPETWPLMEANARFIAAARDLVPALLKERDEARARAAAAMREAADAVEDYCSDMPDLAGHGHSVGLKDAILAHADQIEKGETK